MLSAPRASSSLGLSCHPDLPLWALPRLFFIPLGTSRDVLQVRWEGSLCTDSPPQRDHSPCHGSFPCASKATTNRLSLEHRIPGSDSKMFLSPFGPRCSAGGTWRIRMGEKPFAVVCDAVSKRQECSWRLTKEGPRAMAVGRCAPIRTEIPKSTIQHG